MMQRERESKISVCRILLPSSMSGQVSGAETANFSGTSKTHNSWQPSDSFLFSYPLLSPGLGWSAAGVVTLTGSGELIPAQPTGLPVGKHRARTWAEERRGIPWSLVPGPASQSEWTLPWRRKWWITQRWASHRYFVTIGVYCGE